MSEKLSVKEYAIKHNLTSQSVYNRIKRGTVKSVVEDGKTFVIDEKQANDDQSKNSSKKDKSSCEKLLKKMMKRVDKLEKQLEKEREKHDALLLAYVEEMKALYLPGRNNDTKKKKKDKK